MQVRRQKLFIKLRTHIRISVHLLTLDSFLHYAYVSTCEIIFKTTICPKGLRTFCIKGLKTV
jgi:hypothetical protein